MTIHPVSVPQTNSIAGVESLFISVYPNPTADVLNVNGVNGDAVLYDMRGCVVSTCRINGNEGRLDLGRVANGVYMLRVGDATAKVVVRH